MKPIPFAARLTCFRSSALAVAVALACLAPAAHALRIGGAEVRSALGQHTDKRQRLNIPESQQWVGYGMHHLDLLDNAEVYAQLRKWLS